MSGTGQPLDGRVCLVTGAGRGLGEAISSCLAASGGLVAVADIDLASAERVAGAIPGAKAIAIDVSSWESVEAAAAEVERVIGPVEVLVNNAGVNRVRRSEELSPEDWATVLDVNLSGVWRCCQRVGGRMLDRGRGSIVNLGSAYSEAGAPGRVAYAAAKTGLLGLTRSLASEWSGRGVRVNLIQPGYIDTPMTQITLKSGTGLAQLQSRIPAGRLGNADEVAEVVAFLASDQASYVTGASLRIDGGFLAFGGGSAVTDMIAGLGK